MRQSRGRKTSYRKDRYYDASYNYGSTVRKIDISPVEVVDRRNNYQRRKKNNQQGFAGAMQKTVGHYMGIVVIGVLVAVMAFGGQYYIGMKADIASAQREIMMLESDLNAKTNKNKEEYDRIMGEVDLEGIKRIAMKELGMTYPDSNQIVEYTDNDSDYVRQFDNIQGLDK